MDFLYKRAFLSDFEHLSSHEQNLVQTAEEQIRGYYQDRKAPYGLRIKQLYRGKKGKVLEARVSKSLRLLWVEGKDQVAFVMIGSHDAVRNFLRNLL